MSSVLTTKRLILRELNLEDVAFIVKLLNSPGWLQFIGDRGVKTISDAQNYLLDGPMKSYQANGFGLWMVALKNTGQPIGMCGLIKREMLEDVDIGYALLPQFTGKGYATEMASATLNYGFTSLGLCRIAAITDPKNIHSIKLLKKLGMQFEKMVKFVGEEKDVMFFATSRSNFLP